MGTGYQRVVAYELLGHVLSSVSALHSECLPVYRFRSAGVSLSFQAQSKGPEGGSMKLAVLCVAVGLFLPCAAKAQEFVTSQRLPDSPSAHKFWTLENKVNFSIYSGELAADAITTQMGLSQGMRETNPLARPLVTRGAAGQAVASGLGLGAGLGLTYLLNRTQHHKAERIVTRLMIAGEGAVVAHNIAVLR
jgi:hypothetical protein